MAYDNIPKKDFDNLADMLDSPHCSPGMWTIEVLLENGFEFAGATETEATFVAGDGVRVILTKDKWRMIWPTGKSFEHTSLRLLAEAIDPYLRRM